MNFWTFLDRNSELVAFVAVMLFCMGGPVLIAVFAHDPPKVPACQGAP